MATLREVLGDDAKLTAEAAKLIEIIATATVAKKRRQEAVLKGVTSGWVVREKRDRPVYLSSKYVNSTRKRLQLKGSEEGSGLAAIQNELRKHDVTVEERTFCDELLRACEDNDQAAISQHKEVISGGIPNALAVHIAGRVAAELQTKYANADRSASDITSIQNYITAMNSLTGQSVPHRAQVILSVVLMFVILFADRRQRDFQYSFSTKVTAARTLLSLPLIEQRTLDLIPFDELTSATCHPTTALGVLVLVSEWGLPAIDRLMRRYPRLLGSLSDRFTTSENVYLKSVIFDIIKYLVAIKHSSWLSMLVELHGPLLLLCPEALLKPPPSIRPSNNNNNDNGSDTEYRRIPRTASTQLDVKISGARQAPSFEISFLPDDATNPPQEAAN